MREILFRGKDECSGFWCYGDLSHYKDCKPCIRFWGHNGYLIRSVIPETVGQFTSLWDGNNKRIFEGDVLRVYDSDCFGQDRTYVVVLDDMTDAPTMYGICFAHQLEIIGNIYDDPELLEVNKDA